LWVCTTSSDDMCVVAVIRQSALALPHRCSSIIVCQRTDDVQMDQKIYYLTKPSLVRMYSVSHPIRCCAAVCHFYPPSATAAQLRIMLRHQDSFRLVFWVCKLEKTVRNTQNTQKPLETQKLEAFSTETPLRVLMQNSRNSSELTLVYYSM
jgi:hypothetical protein